MARPPSSLQHLLLARVVIADMTATTFGGRRACAACWAATGAAAAGTELRLLLTWPHFLRGMKPMDIDAGLPGGDDQQLRVPDSAHQ